MIRTLGYLAAGAVLWAAREILLAFEPTRPPRETCPLCGGPATAGIGESGVYCAAHEGLYRAAGEQQREA